MDDFATITSAIIAFRDEREWGQFHTPRNLVSALSIEVAELQQTMLWLSDSEVRQKLDHADKRAAIERELADVLIYALLLAHEIQADPVSIISDKLRENAGKYPIEQSRGNARKYTEFAPGSDGT